MSQIVWVGMSGRQFKALEVYLRVCADLLALKDWTVELMRTPCGDSYLATCNVSFGRRVCSISVCKEWNNLSEQTKRDTVAHELIHCHERPVYDLIESSLETIVGKLAWNTLEPAIRMQREYAVDAIAGVVARQLPKAP